MEEDFLREAAALNSTLKGGLSFYKEGTQTEISAGVAECALGWEKTQRTLIPVFQERS